MVCELHLNKSAFKKLKRHCKYALLLGFLFEKRVNCSSSSLVPDYSFLPIWAWDFLELPLLLKFREIPPVSVNQLIGKGVEIRLVGQTHLSGRGLWYTVS